MNTFIDHKGSVFQCERFMQGPRLQHGNWWRNAYEKTYIEEPMPPDVDPNTQPTLFGYDEKQFLKRQYK